jgi:hypothetical protein
LLVVGRAVLGKAVVGSLHQELTTAFFNNQQLHFSLNNQQLHFSLNNQQPLFSL